MYWHSRLCVALVLSSHSEHQALAGVPYDFAPADVGVRHRQVSATEGIPSRRAGPRKLGFPLGLPPLWLLMRLNKKEEEEKKVAHQDLSSTKSLKYSSLFWPAVQSPPLKSRKLETRNRILFSLGVLEPNCRTWVFSQCEEPVE